ncbi:MAG: NAD(P)-dependent oxidoreductase [Thermodesulfovibrio sp.]|nr:NAD(P)-dependent oxidoreductase [Thermodesulfovibrio sp.]
MIIVDQALQQRQEAGNPIRVAMVGAGFMGRGIAFQICNCIQGMELVAIANRHLDGARQAYVEAGIERTRTVETLAQLEDSIRKGEPAVTEDALLLCRADGIDAVIEVTGTIEFAARVVMTAIEQGKHVIMMNAELDGTVGPILKVYADRAGVIITNVDGDQPGVIMNLYRFVKGIGLRPVMCGNIKGLHDPYRTPTTQKGFAEQWKQKPHMVTSFADGTKISFEQAIVANATGMAVVRRGMLGPAVPAGTPIREAAKHFPAELLMKGKGIVDYVVGAEPSAGVFVLGTEDHPAQKHYLNYYKLGEGPLYCFYTPLHLCHFEVPNTIARAVLYHDAAIAPLGAPMVDVVAAAKTDLKAGEILDGIGCYMTYGLCENSSVVAAQNLLTIGLAAGCRLKRDVSRDAVLSYEDVEVPAGRLSDRLRDEQNTYFTAEEIHAH